MNEVTIHNGSQIATQREPTMLEIIREVASSPNADLSKLEKLLELQERVEARQARVAYAEAMQACQGELRPIVRDAKNESNKSRYARLETVNQAIAATIAKHGFSVSFGTGAAIGAEAVRVVATVRHIAGHSEVHELEAALDMRGPQGSANKTSVQGLGSSVSYLRRYLLLMIFNLTLVNEDNDGQKTGFITEQQAQSIVTLLAQCYTDPKDAAKVEAGFLSYMKAKAVGEIHAIDFVKATQILESKKRALAKQSAEVPEVETLPDAVELTVGTRRRCKAKTYEVFDDGEIYRWKEVKG